MIEYLHHYIVHAGAWFSFIIAANIWKDGAPKTMQACVELLLTASLLSSVGAIGSSVAHIHYNQYIKEVVAK